MSLVFKVIRFFRFFKSTLNFLSNRIMAGISSFTENYTDSEEEGDKEMRRGQQSNESSRGEPSLNSSTRLKALVSYLDDDEAAVKAEDESDGSSHFDLDSIDPSCDFAGLQNLTNPGDSVCKARADDDSLNSDFILMKLLTATQNRPIRPHSDPSLEDPEETEETEPVIRAENLVISGDMQMPPEPPGLCSASLQESINRLWQRKKGDQNFDLNLIIQQKKAFRNPSIYEKLIQVFKTLKYYSYHMVSK